MEEINSYHYYYYTLPERGEFNSNALTAFVYRVGLHTQYGERVLRYLSATIEIRTVCWVIISVYLVITRF